MAVKMQDYSTIHYDSEKCRIIVQYIISEKYRIIVQYMMRVKNAGLWYNT